MEKSSLEDFVRRALSIPNETRVIEFKEARRQYSFDKAAEYCAALANEGGGHLILGVTDKTPRTIIGTEAFRNVQETERKLHDKLRLRIELDEVLIDTHRVVVIKAGARPVGQPVTIDGRYLMRQGESLVDMTPDQLRAIFQETALSYLESSLVSDLEPDQVEEHIDTRAFFSLSKTQAPDDVQQRCQVLAGQRLIARCGAEKYSILGMGAALFARDLTEYENLSPRRLRFLQYRGQDRTDASRDVVTKRGYALEFATFLEMVNAAIPVDERIQESHRRTVPMYQPVALREIVANAIVHQDFTSTPSMIAVELFDGRLEVTNPGLPITNTRRFVEDTKPRNHALAMMMRELSMCEARGSGIQRALEANEETGAADPAFHAGDGLTRAILIGKHDFKTMTAEERNWAIFMHACYLYSRREAITNASFRRRYAIPDKSSSLVSTHIQQTVEEGLLKLQDAGSTSRRFARYVPFYAT